VRSQLNARSLGVQLDCACAVLESTRIVSDEDPEDPELPDVSEEFMHAVRAEWQRIAGDQTPKPWKFFWMLPLQTGDELLHVLRSVPTGAGSEGLARRFRELFDSTPSEGSPDA
jgi:hypothetical protein